jgi:hypothetical protein
LKSLTTPVGWAAGVVAEGCEAGMRRRAEEINCRHAADDLGHFVEGVAEDVVQDERDAFGRGHRFQHDQEGQVDRLG